MMDNHKCVIGLLYHTDYAQLCNLDDLKKHIQEMKEYNDFWRTDPVYSKVRSLGVKCWTLKEYADRRRSTDLTRFNYCPECGKRIDWATLKEEK